MEYMDYLNKLKLKYNYDDDIIVILFIIIPRLIDYFGPQYKEKILQNIYDCKIHIKQENENPNEYISKELGIVDNYITDNNVDGYVTTRLQIKDEKLVKKSIIYLINDNKLEPITQNLISTLVHELCHLIKQQEPQINNNNIILKTGYQFNYYDLDGKLLKRDFVALEETTNSYDEKEIMAKILKLEKYELNGSGYIISEHYLNKLINYINAKLNLNLNNLLIEDKLEAATHLEHFFGPFGVCLLDNFFNQCIEANLLHGEEYYKKIDNIEANFDFILNSIMKLGELYTQINEKDYINYKNK